MPLYIARSGDLQGCHACLTDSHLKDSATQLLIKYKSGALVTQHASSPEGGLDILRLTEWRDLLSTKCTFRPSELNRYK